MRMTLNTASMADYRKFLAIRKCPTYEFRGTDAIVPDEYASMILGECRPAANESEFIPHPESFDYQAAISRIAVAKKRFAVFMECGLGKTLVMLDFARHALQQVGPNRCGLIVSPIMVIQQTINEAARFYPDMEIRQIKSGDLQDFLDSGTGLGITNYEAFNQPLRPGRLGMIGIDESSMLKSHYGKWGTSIIKLSQGIEWKIALTGTPAPNDRIEYANHAVFLGATRTVNEFLSRYFVNRGQTDNRWELKAHALGPFYRDLSHWCIFVTNPATYGWKDNAETIPPIHVHIDRVDLTDDQRSIMHRETGKLFAGDLGGIGSRSKMGQLSKGKYNGENVDTLKPAFIRRMVDSWPDESTIIWCIYNEEQKQIAGVFPEAANISGDTPLDERMRLIEQFKSGEKRILISKGKILGFGLNLHLATRQVFSGLQDSYETYWQCVKRSNRIGSSRPLNVHIPVTELEEPMIATVLQKAKRVQMDTEQQERLFKEMRWES